MAATIEIPTSDGPMAALSAEPDGPARGAVLVIQEAFGLTDHIGSVCDRLAERGWRALAPGLFHRSDGPVFAYGDFDGLLPVMGELTAEGITADVHAGLERLDADGFAAGRCGVVGFCMGGAVSLYAATDVPVGAAVTFYGGGVVEGRFGLDSLVDLAPRLQAPWLGLYGDLDRGIPSEQVERLRTAAAAAPVATEVVRYPDAPHGFNCDDRPDSYHAEAAADGWKRMLAWFDGNIPA